MEGEYAHISLTRSSAALTCARQRGAEASSAGALSEMVDSAVSPATSAGVTSAAPAVDGVTMVDIAIPSAMAGAAMRRRSFIRLSLVNLWLVALTSPLHDQLGTAGPKPTNRQYKPKLCVQPVVGKTSS